MPSHLHSRTPCQPRTGLLLRIGRLFLLFLPVALLAVAGQRVASTDASLLLWLGAAALVLACLFALWARQGGRESVGPVLIMLYVIALAWLMFGANGQSDWFFYLAQALLLVVPVGLFGIQCLRDSGATTMRRARQLAARLSSRREWPADLTLCRQLPEVKALRESLHIDASPALEMLANPHPAVRVAALAALEYRPSWRQGQPQVVLQMAQRAPEAEVRAAAVNALANTDDRVLIESLCDRLHDPSPLVRLAATEAAFWNIEQRWTWVRDHVHQALGDPALQDDGPLQLTGQALPQEVVEDLHGWCGEKGAIALRAALTLSAYYSQQLSAAPGTDLLARLRKELTAQQTPPMLRVELARLLQQARELNVEELRILLAPTMPAPVRLIAAEALLAQGTSPEAVAALHDLARLPNREMALSTAEVVQRRLGVDLGLPRGPLPAVQSRTAAEVARRVLTWANQHDVVEPTPPPRAHPSSRVNLG
jgi:hypothetical protein